MLVCDTYFFLYDVTLLYFRYEPPRAPDLEIFQESAVEAFPTAIVGFAVAFSVAKVYSIKHDYNIDGNQVSYVDEYSQTMSDTRTM